MDGFLLNLSTSLQQNNTEETLKLLKNSDKNDISLNGSDLVKTLLDSENSQIIKLSTELIADLAKVEHNRSILSNETIINPLLNLLESDEYVLNAVRALGNICYENEKAAEILCENGIDKILKIFYNSEKDKLDLKTKISGLLLNIFISKENIKIDYCKFIKHISTILKDGENITDDDFTLHSYLLQIIYSIMVENDDTEYNENLHKKVVNIFFNVNKPELELICLQILFIVSEKDVRLLLAKSNVCQKIIELIEKYEGLIEDEESRSIMKMACDLINNILIDDDSMAFLYDKGNGQVYKKCIEWLDSNDEDLLSTAILAVGNFARNDENCMKIVEEKVSKKLIDLLAKFSKNNANVKILHGLLSTLKNLAVPARNKPIILDEGLIESIQPIFEMDQDIIIFKLLGMLRLIIDGQEQAAKKLISQKSFLEKCVRWSENTFHLGLKREVSRFLAWLLKNCHSNETIFFEIEGIIPCLISMFSSENIIMENEAIISLILLLTSAKMNDSKSKLEKELIECEIASILPYVSIFGNDEKILENFLNLLEILLKSNIILNHFKEKNTFETLKKLNESKQKENIKIQTILSILSQ